MGLSSVMQIQKLLEAAAQYNSPKTISLLQESIDNGVEPSALCAQMQRFLRVIILQPEDADSILKKDFALVALDLLQSAQAGFKVTTHRSLPLEVALVKLSSPTLQTQTMQAKQLTQVASKAEQPPIVKEVAPAERKNVPADADMTSRCAKGLSIIKENNNSLYALLRSGNTRIENNRLVVDCRFNFHKERIEEFRNREMIEKIMTKVCDKEVQLLCVLAQGMTEEPVKENEEIVSSAMAILGGELVDG